MFGICKFGQFFPHAPNAVFWLTVLFDQCLFVMKQQTGKL